MYCRKCGKSIPDDSVFCPYCGETVLIGTESAELEKPAEKQCGFCSNCGAPLPPGKLAGLCESCMEKANTEAAEYGRCENCGAPLDADDDGTLCKSCISKRLAIYSPYPIKEEPAFDETVYRKKTHGGAIAIGIIASAAVIITVAVISNPSKSTTLGAVASDSSASELVSSAPLSARQKQIQTAFDNVIAGDVEGTVKARLSHPDSAEFDHDTQKLSVNNAIFTDYGTVTYKNSSAKKVKENFTVSIIATDKVYYPLYVKIGTTTSLDNRKGTNSLGIATSSGDIFNKTEGEPIFSDSDGTIIYITDTEHANMSLDEYNRIKNGMSYAEVTEIVGSYGSEEAHTDIEGYTGGLYSWAGNGSIGANANVTFENGQVVAKAQFGLK